jgi:hypothetical protein
VTPGNANPSIARESLVGAGLGRRFGTGFPPFTSLACRGPIGPPGQAA